MQHKNVNCNFSEIYFLELPEMTVTCDKAVLFFMEYHVLLLTCKAPWIPKYAKCQHSTEYQSITVISSVRQSSTRDAAREHVCRIGNGVRGNETAVRLHRNETTSTDKLRGSL